jgi:hypothetical protein
MQEGPSLDTVMGSPLLADTPYETLAGIYEYHLRTEAQWRAGRVGMANPLVSSSSTHFGFLAAFHLYDQPQIALCLNPASLKINYTTLHKCIVAMELGGYIRSESPTMIGGYTGSPEGTAIASIATDLLQFPICGAHLPARPRTISATRATAAATASGRSPSPRRPRRATSTILMNKTINQVAGPFTEMFFLETISGMVSASASGQTFTISPRRPPARKRTT